MNNSLFKLFSEALENNNIETLDFTKKEDLEKLKKSVEVIKGNPFFSNFFNDDFLDNLVEKAQSIYDEAHKNDVPIRPSLQVPVDVVKRVNSLADEYLKTMIIPHTKNITEEQINEIKDSLAEFACWIYKK